MGYAPRESAISILTGLVRLDWLGWNQCLIGAWGVLYLGHKIIVGDEGESRCEKRLDDHWLVHSGLARHFLGRRCSRLHNIPSVRMHKYLE